MIVETLKSFKNRSLLTMNYGYILFYENFDNLYLQAKKLIVCKLMAN